MIHLAQMFQTPVKYEDQICPSNAKIDSALQSI